MAMFLGMSGTDYQDVFRALGKFADEQGWRSVRLMEADGGILMQGVVTTDAGHVGIEHTARLFTEQDLRALLVTAYRRRIRRSA